MDPINPEAEAAPLLPESGDTSLEDSRPWEQPAIERNFINDIPAYIGKGDNSPVWPLFNDKAKEVHETMIEGWDKNMDVLLVFSALFSAVVTAFLVLSIALLSPDTSQQAVDALMVISAQLSAINSGGSAPPASYQAPAFEPSTASIGINALWVLSLTISLFTSVLAMLAKQWLRNYSAHLSSGPAQQARQRYTRFDGILVWNVPAMVDSLPVLLHIAVFVFFTGFLVFLWPSSALLTAILAIWWIGGGTTYFLLALGPIIWSSCPYKSPLTTAIEFCTSFQIPGRLIYRDCFKPWWNLPRHVIYLCSYARYYIRGLYSVYPWLSYQTQKSIDDNQLYIDSCLMGWLEANCLDQDHKETILCACFGWKQHDMVPAFPVEFSMAAARAISRLTQPELGLDALATKSLATEAEQLLVRFAIFSSYGNGFGREGWETLGNRPWANISSAKSDDSRLTLLCMGVLLFAAGNHREWWKTEKEKVTEFYSTALPEFCRALQTHDIPLSSLGCWLLLEHMRLLPADHWAWTAVPSEEGNENLAVPLPPFQQLFSTLQHLVATSKGLPECVLASIRSLWARRKSEGSTPFTFTVYSPRGIVYYDSIPLLKQDTTWIRLLNLSLPRASRTATLSYILHNPQTRQSYDGDASDETEKYASSTIFQHIMDKTGIANLLHPRHAGRLPSLDELNQNYSLELRILDECLTTGLGCDTGYDTTSIALQILDLQSEYVRDIITPVPAMGRRWPLFRQPEYSLVADPVFHDLVWRAREYRDPRAAIITTTVVLGVELTTKDMAEHGGEWVELIVETGWLDMLVEYAYMDAFRTNDEHSKEMQEAIARFGSSLIPHLVPLARTVEEHPPSVKIDGFMEQMRKATEYVPPPPQLSLPRASPPSRSLNTSTPSKWERKALLNPGTWLRTQVSRRETDFELGAGLTTLPEGEIQRDKSTSYETANTVHTVERDEE